MSMSSTAAALNSAMQPKSVPGPTSTGTGTTNSTAASQLNAAATGASTGGQSTAGTSPWDSTNNFGGLTINGQKAPGTDTLNVNGSSMTAPVWQGQTIAPIKDVVEKLGGQVHWDPTTGNITVNGNIIRPTTISQGRSFAPIHDIVNALGLPSNSVAWDNSTKTATVTGQPPQQQVQAMQSPYPNYMQSIMTSIPQMPHLQSFVPPDLSNYYSNLMTMQQFNPNWNSYYQQAHNQVDPTTQNSINTLFNKQASDITASDAKMNQRGIWTSGIAQQAENQIRMNTNDNVAKVLMSAQSNISKIAQQLYADAEKQWNDGNTQALKNNQMWLTQAMDAQKQAFTQYIQTQNLTMDQYKYAIDAWDKMSTLVQKDAAMQLQNQQFQQTQAQKMYEFNNLSADQQAQLAQKQYMFDNLSADQKAQLGWDQYKFGNLSADQSATLSLDQQKLVAQVNQWAATDKLDAQKVAISQASLQEKSQYDQAMIDKAAAAQSDTNKRTQLEGLKDQLDAVSKNIQAKQAQLQPGQTLANNDPDIQRYNQIMDQVQSIVNPSGDTSSTDTSNSDSSSNYNSYGNNPFTGN